MITGLMHVSIAVPDLARAARHLNEKYGLLVGPPLVNEQQGVRLAYAELGDARLELMEPARPDSPITRFLERHPNGGIHHFCLGVKDVVGTASALADKGVRMLGGGKPQSNVAGEPIAFIHPGDFLGALVELEGHNGPPVPRGRPEP